MNTALIPSAFLVLLAIVFTIGLTFATVELPYRIDRALQDNVTTPGFDSRADESSRLQTELFIDHYNFREIGYISFALMVLLVIIGFSTRRTGLAAAGALTFMLPAFAQFASVMFFLAGLGILNVLWLPLLDISFDLQRLGMVIHAPYDFVMWLLRTAGINGYWYIVYFFIGGGLLVFFLGTYAWLFARAGGKRVADFWIYRFSRHPQYAGWIMWSYGAYLLLLRLQYPRRSWGISASLPWLLSTMLIIGVAMVEEIKMSRLHGPRYASYRRRAPFLFPMPQPLRRFFSLPLQWIFKRDQPGRNREIVAVLSIYTAVLLGISALFYMDGAKRVSALLSPAASQSARLAKLADELEREPQVRSIFFMANRLEWYGEPAIDPFIGLMKSDRPEVRIAAIRALGRLADEKAVPHLIEALADPSGDIRVRAVEALGIIRPTSATAPLLARLDDPEAYIRVEAMKSLACLGSEAIVGKAGQYIRSDATWARSRTIDALGILGSAGALNLILEGLNDQDPYVRRRSVIALLQTGSDRACDGLAKARGDDDWEVRVYATEASKRLCQ